jgi:hypothetical protein
MIEDVAGSSSITDSGQAEARDLRAHEAAGLGIGVEHGDVVAERREVARDGQRSGPAPTQRRACRSSRRRLRQRARMSSL